MDFYPEKKLGFGMMRMPVTTGILKKHVQMVSLVMRKNTNAWAIVPKHVTRMLSSVAQPAASKSVNRI